MPVPDYDSHTYSDNHEFSSGTLTVSDDEITLEEDDSLATILLDRLTTAQRYSLAYDVLPEAEQPEGQEEINTKELAVDLVDEAGADERGLALLRFTAQTALLAAQRIAADLDKQAKEREAEELRATAEAQLRETQEREAALDARALALYLAFAAQTDGLQYPWKTWADVSRGSYWTSGRPWSNSVEKLRQTWRAVASV